MIRSYSHEAIGLFQRGFRPIPITPGAKRPAFSNWQNTDCAAAVKNWLEGHGIGLLTGDLIAFDIDVYDAATVVPLVDCLRSLCRGEIITRIGQPPKVLIPAICPDVPSKITSNKWIDENGVINQIEILSHGQQFVAYGIHPDTGKEYEWSGDLLTHEPPKIELESIQQLFAKLDELATERGWENLSRKERQVVHKTRPQQDTGGNTPCDLYNRAVHITEVLAHYGWTHYRDNFWTRPGKSTGVSGAVHEDILYCFTSSTCLQENTASDAFEVLAQYEFGGNKSNCARRLRHELGGAI